MKTILRFLAILSLSWVFFYCAMGYAQIVAPQIPLSGNIGAQGFPVLNNGILAMTDASRLMTALETSATGGFKVTGTWTANRTLTMPAGRFQFIAVENATTGGFSLILASASGGTSLTIPNGQVATGVWFDGTNVTGTLQSSGSSGYFTGTPTVAVTGTPTSGQVLTATSGSAATFQTPTTGSGNTTSTSLTTNFLAKSNGANSIVNSTLTDNGTTVSTTETLSAAGLTSSGSTNGNVNLAYTGTAPTGPGTNTFQMTAGAAISSPYSISVPAAPPTSSNGIMSCTGSSTPFQCTWVAGGSGGSGGGCGALLGFWLFNEGAVGVYQAPSVYNQGCGGSNLTTITGGTWAAVSGLGSGGLALSGTSSGVSGSTNSLLQLQYTQPFSVWSWVNLTSTTVGSAISGPRFIQNINAGGANMGWSVGANYGYATGTCTTTTYCPIIELLGSGGYPTNSFDMFCNIGMTTATTHLVVWTYDGTHTTGGTSCYVDNVLGTTVSLSNTLSSSITSNDAITIGYQNGKTTAYVGGSVGPQGVIGRILTATDVATIWGNPYAQIR